ncbi:preprotein translocase subunit YajC [Altererythrobacter sp. KTW20L]|uniref:preprotein translocase subunit YajC n=1 Tax=Altererythrobacter sp. KTW20L TaxID=2942210 RepID=UPI0020BF943C|nr:preprotein translocase subunit YajC [Altererythrobacter sp. KTW20L]MCL6249469.1 preprotein translocase subunit YajC [Altererythrobacter sp. KTW20L]
MLDFLAAGSGSAGQGLIGFIPIIGMVLIFWFLIIRPQMKQQKAHRAKVAAVKRGDQIVTSSGIVAKVTKVDDEYIEAEIAQGVKVKVVKSMLGDVIAPGGTAAND